MSKVVESKIQIRFADADCLNHINNVNLQHYFDIGKMDFYEKVLGKPIGLAATVLYLFPYILISIVRAGSRQILLYVHGLRK